MRRSFFPTFPAASMVRLSFWTPPSASSGSILRPRIRGDLSIGPSHDRLQVGVPLRSRRAVPSPVEEFAERFDPSVHFDIGEGLANASQSA